MSFFTLARTSLLAIGLSLAAAPALACGPYGAVEPTVLADGSGAERARWTWSTRGIEVRDDTAKTGWKTVLADQWVHSAQLKDGRIHVEGWDALAQERTLQILELDGDPVSQTLADALETEASPQPDDAA